MEPSDNQNTPEQGQVEQTGQEKTVDTGATGVEQNVQKSTNSTTDKTTQPAQPVFDVQKSYDELRKEFTRRTQHEAEMVRKLQSIEEYNQRLAEQLAKATEKPFNIEQFKRDWETHGPKALDDYFGNKLKALEEKYTRQLNDERMARTQVNAQLELYARRGDSENYPDFEKLEEKMTAIANDPSCPVDLTKPIAQVLDALYKLAREQNSSEAVKMAESLGRKKAEAQLAKEAKTSVAGGGKTQGGIPSDLSQIKDFKKLEQIVEGMVGIADRD